MNRVFFSVFAICWGIFSNAQTESEKKGVGINTHAPKATLQVNSLDKDKNPGVLLPNVEKANLKSESVESTLLYSTNTTEASKGKHDVEVTAKGFYYWDDTQKKWMRVMQKAQIYLPSIVVSAKQGTYKLDLYNIYASQFTMGRTATNRVEAGIAANANSTGTNTKAVGVVSSTGALGLRIFTQQELEYYVVYYDNTVFENLSIDANGMLTYSVKQNAQVTEQTFMNIVLQEK